MNQSDELKVENSMDLLLVLLYAPSKNGQYGEPIEGITRLQKLFFLLQQGKGPQTIVQIAKDCGYQPYKMGPFSWELTENLNDLIAAGLVKTERLRYYISDDFDGDDSSLCEDILPEQKQLKQVESFKYLLTDYGMNVAKQLWDNLPKKDQVGLAEFKVFFGSLTLRQLLIFVYEQFPKYTDKSEIKHKLGLA